MRGHNVVAWHHIFWRAGRAIESVDSEAVTCDLNGNENRVGRSDKWCTVVGESTGVVEVYAGGPLNRVQVLRGSSIAGGVLSIAAEGSSLSERISGSGNKEATKQTSDENPIAILPMDRSCRNKHEISIALF
jgi:hypothetical protein